MTKIVNDAAPSSFTGKSGGHILYFKRYLFFDALTQILLLDFFFVQYFYGHLFLRFLVLSLLDTKFEYIGNDVKW